MKTYCKKSYVQSCIEKDKTSMLRNCTDPTVLFTTFSSLFSFNDAEMVFSFAARDIKFNEKSRATKLKRGPWWIKSKFGLYYLIYI